MISFLIGMRLEGFENMGRNGVIRLVTCQYYPALVEKIVLKLRYLKTYVSFGVKLLKIIDKMKDPSIPKANAPAGIKNSGLKYSESTQ